MRLSRSLGRNVHIYSAKDTSTVIGGLVATNGMTNANFYSIVEIVFIFDNDYTLCYKSGTTVQRDDNPLQAGKYLINTAGSLTVNNEPWLVRKVSTPDADSAPGFRESVRGRDCRCVVTGERSTFYEKYRKHWDWVWKGYDAVHIFPLAHEQHWVDHGYDSLVTIPASEGSINSVQNGMLLRRDIALEFESYVVSINPDVSI